ncbi:MAG: exosortase C-terminal domain/associated protein EpsI, partial [Terriglobales bacterium]
VSTGPNSWLRFMVVVGLLVATGLFLGARGAMEQLPPRQELSLLPEQIARWTGRDLTIQPEVRKVLGAGDFLSRIYSRSPEEPYIELFVAYFPSQRSGSTIHSPQNCLPGAGWTPVEAGRIRLALGDGNAIPANRYVIARGLDRQLVLYWYQSHSRVVASEYWAKFYLVADAIRLRRSDGALVRIITPLASGEDSMKGELRATEFARALRPVLEAHIPR